MDDINDETDERTRLCAGGPESSYHSITSSIEDNTRPEEAKADAREAFCGDNKLTKYFKKQCSVQGWKQKLPCIEWMPKYRLKHFVGDLVAGFTVGLTVIPQGMAYAKVAELEPQYGLYSAFMGGFIYCFFGTSKDVTLGPTAIMSLMVAEFGSERSPVKHDPTYAIILTLFAGLIQFAMGLLNLGFIVQFISFPVISGFTSAASVLIAFGQVKTWLGLEKVPRDFIPQVRETFRKIPETNLWDFTMGLICMILLMLMKKLKEFIDPKMKTEKRTGMKVLYKIIWLLCTARNAVIVILSAAIAAIFVDLYGYRDKVGTRNFFSLTGDITEGIPTPRPPQLSFSYTSNNETIYKPVGEVLGEIGEGFFVIALIGLLESIAIAKAFARKNEYQIDANQELIALGVSNVFSCFFHSFPVTGSFSRTAINSQSGVRTPAGSIWTGALVLISLAVLTPYFYYIPQASLAAVIICAVILMFEYEAMWELWLVKKLDLIPLFLTFFLSIFMNIEYGIMAGVGFSILMLIFPAARPDLEIRHERSINTNGPEVSDSIYGPKEAVVLTPNPGLKFPGIEYIKDKVMKHGVYEDPPKTVILNAKHFAGIDFSTVQGLMQVCEYFVKHNLSFIIAAPSYEVLSVLQRAHIKGLVIADSEEDALRMAFEEDESKETAVDNVEEGKINGGFSDDSGRGFNHQRLNSVDGPSYAGRGHRKGSFLDSEGSLGIKDMPERPGGVARISIPNDYTARKYSISSERKMSNADRRPSNCDKPPYTSKRKQSFLDSDTHLTESDLPERPGGVARVSIPNERKYSNADRRQSNAGRKQSNADKFHSRPDRTDSVTEEKVDSTEDKKPNGDSQDHSNENGSFSHKL